MFDHIEPQPLPESDAEGHDGREQEEASASRVSQEELDLVRVAMISLAKREEEIFVRGRREPLRLSRRSPALRRWFGTGSEPLPMTSAMAAP